MGLFCCLADSGASAEMLVISFCVFWCSRACQVAFAFHANNSDNLQSKSLRFPFRSWLLWVNKSKRPLTSSHLTSQRLLSIFTFIFPAYFCWHFCRSSLNRGSGET